MLGWATVALGLFYIAWRYNIFFVTDTQIDTRGMIYPRAMKQLFTGLYLGEVCMIGLFGASVAPGPLVLMVILLIFTVLFHISLNSALDPLINNLPMTLMAEEESRLLGPQPAVANNGHDNGHDHAEKGVHKDETYAEAEMASHMPKRGNVFTKFLKPWIYADYDTLRALVPRTAILEQYTDEVSANAYYPPTVTSGTPLLWIPSDAAGVSKQEIAHTSRVIPITDEGCELNEKGKLVWDTEASRPPVWEEKIYY